MAKRIIAIGDVHGNYNALVALLQVIEVNPKEDVLVFLGDYIDRGPKSKEVLQTLIGLKKEFGDCIILLRGNHEHMAEAALTGDAKMFKTWINNGAETTIISFRGKEALEEMLLPFVAKLPFYYEIDECIFAHASFPMPDSNGKQEFDPNNPDHVMTVMWARECDWYQGKKLIVGHTPHREVTKYKDCIVVDSKAYRSDLLSGYDVLNNMVYESNGSIHPLIVPEPWKFDPNTSPF